MKILTCDEITEDNLFLFTFCYENNLNFGRLYRLYNLSKKVFWGYLGALTPIIKIGVKKVRSYENTAHKIMNMLVGVPFTELTEREKHILNLFMLFVSNTFINARYSSIKTKNDFLNKKLSVRIGAEKGYTTAYIGENYNISNLSEVIYKDTTYYRMSRIEAILGRYFPDMLMTEINTFTIKDFEKMINKLQEEKGKVFANNEEGQTKEEKPTRTNYKVCGQQFE